MVLANEARLTFPGKNASSMNSIRGNHVNRRIVEIVKIKREAFKLGFRIFEVTT